MSRKNHAPQQPRSGRQNLRRNWRLLIGGAVGGAIALEISWPLYSAASIEALIASPSTRSV